MGDKSGRSSPRLKDQSISKSASITDSQLKQLVVDIKRQNDTIIDNQERCLERMEKHSEDISILQTENHQLKRRVGVLEEQMTRMDQYSRKSVMIVTGMDFTEEESQQKLESRILGMLNDILGRHGSLSFTLADFVAIHRNGRRPKNGRPPTVTVKFLRYFEKDSLFVKRVIQCRKNRFPDIRFHHAMCPGFIEVQKLLSAHPRVKFANFEGCNRFFSVCVKDNTGSASGNDFFLNRIQSVAHLEAELANSNGRH